MWKPAGLTLRESGGWKVGLNQSLLCLIRQVRAEIFHLIGERLRRGGATDGHGLNTEGGRSIDTTCSVELGLPCESLLCLIRQGTAAIFI